VPEEFAAAYRAAYERALAQQSAQTHRKVEDDYDPDDVDDADADDTDELGAVEREPDLPRRGGKLFVGKHRGEPDVQNEVRAAAAARRSWLDEVRGSQWFVPALLVLLAVLLILGAYALGRAFAGSVDAPVDSSSSRAADAGTSRGADRSQGSSGQGSAKSKPWHGPVAEVDKVKATVGCTAKSGVDASGKKVDYKSKNMTDGDKTTTWRCDGTATGETITLKLPKGTQVAEVGLIPGYAKTDPADGSDRYRQNNRITKVRWTIGDTELVQEMSGSAADRRMRTMRVPRTPADEIELAILEVTKGPRNTTAISEIRVAAAG
jgi:hypothetical protein